MGRGDLIEVVVDAKPVAKVAGEGRRQRVAVLGWVGCVRLVPASSTAPRTVLGRPGHE